MRNSQHSKVSDTSRLLSCSFDFFSEWASQTSTISSNTVNCWFLWWSWHEKKRAWENFGAWAFLHKICSSFFVSISVCNQRDSRYWCWSTKIKKIANINHWIHPKAFLPVSRAKLVLTMIWFYCLGWRNVNSWLLASVEQVQVCYHLSYALNVLALDLTHSLVLLWSDVQGIWSVLHDWKPIGHPCLRLVLGPFHFPQ